MKNGVVGEAKCTESQPKVSAGCKVPELPPTLQGLRRPNAVCLVNMNGGKSLECK